MKTSQNKTGPATGNHYVSLRKDTTCVFCGDVIPRGRIAVVHQGGTKHPHTYRCLLCDAQIRNPNRLQAQLNANANINKDTDPRGSDNCAFVKCGTAPKTVQCACFGFPKYEMRVRAEIEKWIPFLIKFFGPPPTGSGFYLHTENRKAGPEHTVVFCYRQDSEVGVTYANKVRANLPNTWDDGIVKDTAPSKVRAQYEQHYTSSGEYMLTCADCGAQNSSLSAPFYIPGGYVHGKDKNKGALCNRCFHGLQ